MLGLAGVACSSALYGYSTKFWQLIVTRSLSGALNGNVAVSTGQGAGGSEGGTSADPGKGVVGRQGGCFGDHRRVECA